jgi:predicted permease
MTIYAVFMMRISGTEHLGAFVMTSLKFTLRQLRKSPGFSLTAILTLALGIGAAASIFSVVNTVLLKPFAFRDPGRLVVMREVVDEMKAQSPVVPDNYLHYLRLKRDSKTLEDAAIFRSSGASVSLSGDHPQMVGSVLASPNFFHVLGVQPMMGRDFTAKDGEKGADDVVILSYSGWKALMNGDPNVIGKTLRNGGKPNTIIGVLPAGVNLPEIVPTPGIQPRQGGDTPETMIFEPMVPSGSDLRDDNYDYNFNVIARLRPGVTLEQASAELDGLQHAYSRSAHLPVHIGVFLTPLAEDVTSGINKALWLLFGAVGAVLLIACVNLANLQLARAVAAERETAVRAALGANRLQIVMARLMESLVLAVLGGIGGVALTFVGVRLLLALAPANVPRLNEVQVSFSVLLFAGALSVATAILFGILPALRSLRVNPQAALQAGSSRSATGSQEVQRVRSVLVASEVACTVVLLIVTALILRSFSQVLNQNRGFDSGHVTIAQANLFAPQYGDSLHTSDAAKVAFIDRALAALGQLPGVRATGMTSVMPLTGETWVDNVTRADHPVPPAQQPLVNLRWVSPDYLATMQMALTAGRNFTAEDRNNPHVVLLSEKAARDIFPGENPIGRKIDSLENMGDTAHPETVIGVVANARINGLKDEAAMAYMPYWVHPPWTVSFLVRSEQTSDALIPEVRRVIWGVDPQVAIPVLKSLDAQVSESVATDRFQTILLSGFGVAALLLALLGVYGVLAYSVSLRQQEFGIRIALGSDKARLMLLVLRQAAWPVVSGSVVGLVLAFVVTRWLRSLLYETRTVDPIAILGSLLLLGIAAALAAILPARRAAGVDPVEVLRAQ